MKKILSMALALVLMAGLALPAAAATHGTTDKTVTEDMVDNTPPADYVVNSATQAQAREGKYNAFFLKDDLQTVETPSPRTTSTICSRTPWRSLMS